MKLGWLLFLNYPKGEYEYRLKWEAVKAVLAHTTPYFRHKKTASLSGFVVLTW
jgi:hypothetical protein